MNIKTYRIMQIVLVIGMFGLISLIVPIRFFDLEFNIFAFPTKNIIAFFGIVAIFMGISYFLRKQVKEVIEDERSHAVVRKAAYYTLNIIFLGFIAAMVTFRAITVSNPLPEYVTMAKIFSIVTGITGWLYVACYYIFNYKN